MENPIIKEAIKVQTVLDLAEAADFIQNKVDAFFRICFVSKCL